MFPPDIKERYEARPLVYAASYIQFLENEVQKLKEEMEGWQGMYFDLQDQVLEQEEKTT